MSEKQKSEVRPKKEFRFDEVLTAVSGVNFLDIRDDPDQWAFTRRMSDLLGFMTGEQEQQETLQLPRLADEVTPAILAGHPELADLLKDIPPEPAADASEAERQKANAASEAWHKKVMAEQGERMGESVELSPLAPEDHTHIDPEAEVRMMGGKVLGHTDEVLDLINAQRTRVAAPPEITLPVTHEWGVSDAELRAERALGRFATPPQIAGLQAPHPESPPVVFDQPAYERELTEHHSARELDQVRPPHPPTPPQG